MSEQLWPLYKTQLHRWSHTVLPPHTKSVGGTKNLQNCNISTEGQGNRNMRPETHQRGIKPLLNEMKLVIFTTLLYRNLKNTHWKHWLKNIDEQEIWRAENS
jgi:hypothetical protein